MKRFCLSALADEELDDIAKHLGDCSPCHHEFAASLRRQRGPAPVSFTLAPEFWLRHEHVDYEQLVEIADNRLDATDREMLDLHLKICPTCREDVRSFLAFRQESEPELQHRYGPITQEPGRALAQRSWWSGLLRKPAYAIGVLILVTIALAVSFVLLKRRTTVHQAQRHEPTQTGSTEPSPAPTKGESGSAPSPGADNNATAEVVVLRDGNGDISVEKSGRINGLGMVSAKTQRDVAQVLLANRIDRPEIMKELAGQNSKLRGSSKDRSLKLLYPARAVIASNQPRFKWEGLSGASSYRVYVVDADGREVARSADLSAETTWTPNTPLKRGAIYSWTVVADVDGKEIVSPGPAAPEVRFQVLSTSSLRELHQLRRIRSHLALGVFYVRVGMISEAEREFRELLRLNPSSREATNLLRNVRVMRGRE